MLRSLSRIINSGRIIVMRHAETNYNWPRKRIQGMSPSNDIFVSEKGKREIISKLSSTKFPSTLICSPLVRCKQTAAFWAGVEFDKIKSKKIIIDGLKEIDAGDLEHFYVDEVEGHEQYKKIWQLWKKDPLQFTGFPKGETLQQFQFRVLGSFSSICGYYLKNPEQDICVITHGGPIRILRCFLANKDLSHMWNEEVENLDRLELTMTQIINLKNYSIGYSDNKTRFFDPVDKQPIAIESKSPVARLRYYDKQYKSDHWALQVPSISDKNFVATLKINSILMGLYLNPTDARGYRGIIRLIADDKSKMASTFNRDYSFEERQALSTALTIFERAYENFGMIAQISIAGNNSQSVNPDGSVQIGNEKEPSLLHGHIIARGNPDTCYIGTVPLRGPKAGAEMNLRGDGKDEGNTAKVKWKDEELEVVANKLGSEVARILESTPSIKDVEIISIRHNDPKKANAKSSYGKWIAGALVAVGAGGLFALRFAQSGSPAEAISSTPLSKL